MKSCFFYIWPGVETHVSSYLVLLSWGNALLVGKCLPKNEDKEVGLAVGGLTQSKCSSRQLS